MPPPTPQHSAPRTRAEPRRPAGAGDGWTARDPDGEYDWVRRGEPGYTHSSDEPLVVASLSDGRSPGDPRGAAQRPRQQVLVVKGSSFLDEFPPDLAERAAVSRWEKAVRAGTRDAFYGTRIGTAHCSYALNEILGCADVEHIVRHGAWHVVFACLLYTSPSPRDGLLSRMPSSA